MILLNKYKTNLNPAEFVKSITVNLKDFLNRK